MRQRLAILTIMLAAVNVSSQPSASIGHQAQETLVAVASPNQAPAVTLLEAIALADRHLASRQMDTSRHFLSSAGLILHERTRVWRVVWDSKIPSEGGQLEVLVAMDRSIRVLGSGSMSRGADEKVPPKAIEEKETSIRADLMESWGPQKDYFARGGFEIISWERAKCLLLAKSIVGGKQYHTGWLALFGLSGEAYLARQPHIDGVFEFAKEHALTLPRIGTE